MSTCSPEQSLLLATARTLPGPHVTDLLREATETLDWTRLIETAQEHGVTGLLCRSLLDQPDLVPDVLLGAARQHLQQQRSTNQLLADQLTDILAELAAGGIEAIPFKGPTLALTAYGDLALRSFRDLDFLIHEEQMQSCLEKLREIGYTQNLRLSPKQLRSFLTYSGQDILYGDGTPIEPHWAFAPSTLALDIDYCGIWDRAEYGDFNGRSILRLAPEDELIILCVHGGKERWTKLKWVADIAGYIRSHPALDWDELMERAELQGLGRMVRLGLGLAGRLIQAPLPPALTGWIKKDETAANWCRHLADTFFEVDTRARSIYQLSRFHWEIRERRRDRWRYLLRTVTQPRELHYMSIALPDRFFFLYTPYKLLHDYLALPAWLWLKRQRHPSGQPHEAAEPERTDAAR